MIDRDMLMDKMIHISNPLQDGSFIKNNLGEAWKPEKEKGVDIFSNSLDSEKAPILFTTARLDAIEAMASDGISTVDDTLWLVQELRKRNEEAIRVENWVMGMRGKLEGCLERVKD